MTKKIFAMFLAVLMVVSMLPTSVFAAEACPGQGTAHSLKNCADYTAVYTKPANCGEQGYTTYKCNKCGDTFVDSWVAPSGEHTMVPAAEEDNVPAYCGVEGAEGGMICSVCKNYREGQKVIPAIGEKGVTQCEMPAWEVVVKDCTENFTMTRTCLNCTKTETYEYKLGQNEVHAHEWGAWEVKTPATATAPGVAVRKCTHKVEGKWSCGATEEEEIFFAHKHDAKTLLSVAKVPETCTATGVAAHDMCRICGKLFVSGVEKTMADLVIPAYHDQLKADKTKLNCKNTSMVCDKTDCEEVIRIDINQAHDFGAWNPARKATCVLDGYRTAKCELCDYVKTENLPALGHIEASYTVAATCSQYEYTFKYCLRDGCTVERLTTTTKKNGTTNVSFDLTVGSALLTAPTANLGFYLQVQQGNLDKTLYFNGKTANKSYYLATTEKIEEAVLVYLEVATDDGVNQTYKMYFYDEDDVKTYISIYKSGNYINAQISANAPTTTWAWNAEKGILTTEIDEVEYYIGTYNEYKTLSASKLSYLDTSFGSEMLVVNGATGVRMLDITPNFTAGKAPEAHKLETLSETASTCLVNGTRIQICSLCKTVMPAETLDKADHNWVDDGIAETVNTTANCLTEGKEYRKCSVCGVADVKVTPATGHTYKKDSNDQIVVVEEKGNHKNIITYKFNICTSATCPLKDQKDYNGNSLNDTTNGGARVIIDGTVGAWVGTGKVYKDEDAAAADHPGFTATDANAKPEYDKAATCTVAGYKAYSCADCSNTVMIKSWAGHSDYEAAQIAASCTQEGGFYTYTCVCGEVVGKACTATCTHEDGKHWNKTADKLVHDWEMNEAYDPDEVDCDAPEYYTLVKSCKNCSEKVYAHKEIPSDLTSSAMLCQNGYYEHYYCYECDENHMRSFISGMAHEWVNVGTPTAPTCTTFGHQDKVCKWCEIEADKVDSALEVIPMVPHKNAAGDEFWANCKDKTVDRHCVVCCKACGHKEGFNCLDADGKAETKDDYCKDCYYPALNHVYGDWIYVEDTCEELPYKYHICTVCFDTPAAEFIDEIKVGEDEKGNDIMEDVVVGHRPVAVDKDKNGKEIYYGQYKYEDYKDYAVYNWVVAVDAEGKEVLDENGKALKVLNKTMMPGYEAKYIEYTAPTYTTAGSAKFLCACCNEIVEVELPAISGLGFEIKYENANGQEGITMGSLVNVTLYANGNNVEVNTFTLTAGFEDMIFVGAQPATNDFNIRVTKTENANSYEALLIYATAVNSADKKQQNIVIGEKTPIVTMQFIAWGEGMADVEMFGSALALNGANVDCTPKDCEIEIKEFLNFNEDEEFNIIDLIQAESILTGESEKTYDVSVDVDKDGEVTLYDLNLIYEFLVNIMEVIDNEEAALEFLCNGLSEEHVAIVRAYLDLSGNALCNNPECGTEIQPGWNRCPVCGNIQ